MYSPHLMLLNCLPWPRPETWVRSQNCCPGTSWVLFPEGEIDSSKWIRVKYFITKDVNIDLKRIFHNIWIRSAIFIWVLTCLGPDPEYSIYGKLFLCEITRWDLLPLGNYPFSKQKIISIQYLAKCIFSQIIPCFVRYFPK